MFTEILLGIILAGASVPDCASAVADRDRRGFDELSAVEFDVDLDGKRDKIVPRTYVGPPGRGSRNSRERESHWIAFDVQIANKPRKSFFHFRYGSDLADYWIYALVPCRANKDGLVDLIFYTGDDTTSDTVIFRNTRTGFVVHSRKHIDDVFAVPQRKTTRGRRTQRG